MTDASSQNQCPGSFLGAAHTRNERRTWFVVALTTLMMVGEIAGGAWYGSMALLADGWHMATHAAALSIAALAYRYARRHARDPEFSFGTGKVGELAGFASAVTLGLVALLIAGESVQRLIDPRPISFLQAGAIAVLGLVVNLVSAFFLRDGHSHADHPDHDHEPAHSHAHRDTNLYAAYMHVLADALTSVLAILGLLAGRYLGWNWMDPLIGIVGAVVIGHWSVGLMRSAGRTLLDARDNSALIAEIRRRLENGDPAVDRVTDLHLWTLGPGHDGLIVSLHSAMPVTPAAYKARLKGMPTLSHVTIEVNGS
ncbi:MAG: CDF family Co(II)/Ni(II) efflux transporter DmeF [Pseudomonadota bacterium]